MIEKVTALQREHIDKELQQWDKGEWKESASTKPLDTVIQSIKDKYDYKEDNII